MVKLCSKKKKTKKEDLKNVFIRRAVEHKLNNE